VKRLKSTLCHSAILLSLMLSMTWISIPPFSCAQAVPYARTFPKSKVEVEKALKELQAYSGQKLPVIEGFVATGDQPLDRYERAYFQYSIDMLSTSPQATTVRVTAKITAWHVDPSPWKSGYEVLPSNGRLELDLLDRLGEKFGEKPVTSVLKSEVQAPTPKLNLSTGLPGGSPQPGKSSAMLGSSAAAPSAEGMEEVAALRAKREAEEKRMLQLTSELQSWRDVQHNQAHPLNLVVVKKTGTPVLARPAEDAHVLFAAAENDEFEFIEAEGPWIHVEISGASRGYIRRSGLELPEYIATRLKSPNGTASDEKQEPFRIEREETAAFPGDWDPLRGKSVKIYTVQPASQDPKETGAAAKLNFAFSIFQKFSTESVTVTPPVEGVVIIFDSADGGIIGTTLLNVQQFAGGSLPRDNFWKQCYVDPPEAFRPNSKP
jgi:hypothetical protein